MDKDYYKILGVIESDSAENIKTAYRKLARKWHPDIAGNSEDVMLKFKEINEAYEILSDKFKRAEYDKARMFYNYAKNGSESVKSKTEAKNNETKSSYASNPQNKGFSFNWEDFIPKKSKTEKTNNLPKQGKDIFAEVEITVFEAVRGTEKTINVLQSGVCPKCGGRKFTNGSLCRFCNGKGETSQYKKFTVKIPAGIKNGSKIRIAGEGESGTNGGRNGDLYIKVNICENKEYKIEGLNVIKTLAISPSDAVLGCTAEVKNLDETYSVKIPPQTQNGQKIRLTGCGIVQNNKIGDMIIVVEIRIPKTLTKEEIDLYKRLAELSSSCVRENIND